MSELSSCILLVADHVPPEAHAISELLGRSELRFKATRMADAIEHLESSEVSAALILAGPEYFASHHRDLTHLLDTLCERQIGSILLTFNDADQQTATRITTGDGVMPVPHTASCDELAGRLASLAALKPILDQMRHENAMLRRFDTGLNNTINLIDEEMRLAARLQYDFLPRKLPAMAGVSFDVLFRPCSYVSGDIYDATRLDESHVGFWIADAVGHGMPAALLTIFLKHALHTKEVLDNGYRIIPPDEALFLLNNELCGQQLSMCQFVTMAYGVLNTKTLELQFARAGHPLPFILKPNGDSSEIDAEGSLLGVFENEKFELVKIQLEPGDAILIYSDGFESAFTDPAGAINERYRDEFKKLACENPMEKFSAMVQSLYDQEGSLHPRDDLTALLLATEQLAVLEPAYAIEEAD